MAFILSALTVGLIFAVTWAFSERGLLWGILVLIGAIATFVLLFIGATRGWFGEEAYWNPGDHEGY